MKYALSLVTLMALPVALSGCEKEPEAQTNDVPKVAETASDMPTMAMPLGSKMGSGSGTVTAVNAASGKITLNHGAIPAVGWPAMKMSFAAKPGLLKEVAVGDRIDFNVTVTGSAGEVTAIKKR